jgi:exodeoxyribonuclease VIII
VADIKTTKDASAESFSKDAWSYRYDVQAAFYLDAYRTLTGREGRFIFICVETEPPYLVACYVATPEMIAAGRARYRQNLATYASCVESGTWPGYGDAVMPLDLPAWAVKSVNPNT